MVGHPELPPGTRHIVVAAALVVLIFGLQAAQVILVPVLLAAFLAVLGARPMFWLRARGLPHALAVTIVVLAMVAVALLVSLTVGASITEFSNQLPFYQARLEEALTGLFGRFDQSRFPTSFDEIVEAIEPGAALRLTAGLLTSLGSLFANAFLIFFTLVFILLEASTFAVKLRAIRRWSGATFEPFARFASSLQHYLYLKTLTSLLTGACIAVWAAVLGLDFPLLWGLLAFLLNYIPNIGSILAALPAILLGFIQFGIGMAAIVALGYLAINLTISNLLEPRLMGRELGLSALVVFLALVFWGWVFGPVGMLLSVPLTMTLKIALESSDRTRWAAILLGDVRATAAPEADLRSTAAPVRESPASQGS